MKFKVVSMLSLALALAACKVNSSELNGRNKPSDGSKADSFVARKVHSLKTESGMLSCSGVDSKLNYIRTRAEFNAGKLSSLVVAGFANKQNPQQVPNDLTPNLKDYQIFSHELISKVLDLDIDLDGSKFEIEAVVAVGEEPKKLYDLEIRVENDGEGSNVLNAYLAYKEPSTGLNLSEVFMGCAVLPKN